MYSRTVWLALAMAFAACGPAAEPDTDPDVGAALDSVYAVFSEAYAQANLQLLMDEVYARDGYYLPPDSPILHGQDQFRGHFNFLERYAREERPGPRISFDIVDRDIAGDMAYDIGVYTLRPPGAPDAPDAPDAVDAVDDAEGGRGKFIVIWKRIDGEWRIWADGYSDLGDPPE